MEQHYDGWSDWNILLSIGCGSTLITNRGSIKIGSGDVVIFDGNHIYHGVQLDSPESVQPVKIKGNKYYRATLQYRRRCRQLPYYRKK